MKAIIRWMIVMSIVGSITGCGKNIPDIDPQLLNKKASVLVVTGSGLQEGAKQSLQTALNDWRAKKQTAFEWLPGTTALTEDQIQKIKAVPYDYVIVVGHALVQSTLPAAEQIGQRKWVFLDDAVDRAGTAVKGDHIELKNVSEARLRQEWDEWVRQQLVSGRSIEWVTTSAYPIPSEWAPSEEGEYVHMTDMEGWFNQLQSDARRHGSAWLAVFAPLEASQLQRLGNLQLTVASLADTGVELQWNGILASLQQMMDQKTWTPGVQPYTGAEAKILKKI